MTESIPNPDFEVLENNFTRWNQNAVRRESFRNLHRINRYGLTLRSDQVMPLKNKTNNAIAAIAELQSLTNRDIFCGMAVVKGGDILFEKYAPDFSARQPHTIMSISKTTVNLIIGKLVASGHLDLGKKVGDYLPTIGSGYREASLQQVMDMDVVNNYKEEYADPNSTSYANEVSIGWRIEGENINLSQREYLPTIRSEDIQNHSGEPIYKSANTDVLAWIAEEVSGKPLRQWLLDIVEAAGFEDTLYVSTDRDGMPILDGGISLTLRDLARYGLLFARLGRGVAGRQVGNSEFIEHSRQRASLEFPAPRRGMYYSNQFYTDKTWIGHGGWGGQFMLANPDTGTVCVIFSVLENDGAYDLGYTVPMVKLFSEIAENF